MPRTTFFNLPEEKRQRLIEAAWEEITSVSFEKVSINRIVQNASISRGSFYQYFDDKMDLLRFLLSEIRRGMEKKIQMDGPLCTGDLFESALKGYDWIIMHREDKELRLPQLVSLAQINPEMDLALDMDVFRHEDQEKGRRAKESLWRTEEITVEDHIELLCEVVGGAALKSFRRLEEIPQIRERLKKHLLILKHGMLDVTVKGEESK